MASSQVIMLVKVLPVLLMMTGIQSAPHFIKPHFMRFPAIHPIPQQSYQQQQDYHPVPPVTKTIYVVLEEDTDAQGHSSPTGQALGSNWGKGNPYTQQQQIYGQRPIEPQTEPPPIFTVEVVDLDPKLQNNQGQANLPSAHWGSQPQRGDHRHGSFSSSHSSASSFGQSEVGSSQLWWNGPIFNAPHTIPAARPVFNDYMEPDYPKQPSRNHPYNPLPDGDRRYPQSSSSSASQSSASSFGQSEGSSSLPWGNGAVANMPQPQTIPAAKPVFTDDEEPDYPKQPSRNHPYHPLPDGDRRYPQSSSSSSSQSSDSSFGQSEGGSSQPWGNGAVANVPQPQTIPAAKPVFTDDEEPDHPKQPSRNQPYHPQPNGDHRYPQSSSFSASQSSATSTPQIEQGSASHFSPPTAGYSNKTPVKPISNDDDYPTQGGKNQPYHPPADAELPPDPLGQEYSEDNPPIDIRTGFSGLSRESPR